MPCEFLGFGDAVLFCDLSAEAMADVVQASSRVDTGFLPKSAPGVAQSVAGPGSIFSGQEQAAVGCEQLGRLDNDSAIKAASFCDT